MPVDENRIRHLPEPVRTDVRRILLVLDSDALTMTGEQLREARIQAGYSLRTAANLIWSLGPEDAAIIHLATLECAAQPVMEPEMADYLNGLYGLKTKPLPGPLPGSNGVQTRG